jgi:hypothetical protein
LPPIALVGGPTTSARTVADAELEGEDKLLGLRVTRPTATVFSGHEEILAPGGRAPARRMTPAQIRTRFRAVVERAIAKDDEAHAAHLARLRAAGAKDRRQSLAASRTKRRKMTNEVSVNDGGGRRGLRWGHDPGARAARRRGC